MKSGYQESYYSDFEFSIFPTRSIVFCEISHFYINDPNGRYMGDIMSTISRAC